MSPVTVEAMNTSRTIEQLEAAPWSDPSGEEPPHFRRCHALRRVPLEQLTPGDLRALITQDIGLKYLVPLALDLLKSDPMLEAEYYPGDLLCATMSISPGYWPKAPQEFAALTQLAERAEAAIARDPYPTQFRQISKDITHFRAHGAA
jgi:hypothetical protein